MKKTLTIAVILFLMFEVWYLVHNIVENNKALYRSAVFRNDLQDSLHIVHRWRLNGQGMFLRSHLDKKHRHEMDDYFEKGGR